MNTWPPPNMSEHNISDSEGFTVVTSSNHPQIYSDWVGINGAAGFSPDIALQAALRRQYPGLALTVTTSNNGTSSITS